jgi:hypothetical protein
MDSSVQYQLAALNPNNAQSSYQATILSKAMTSALAGGLVRGFLGYPTSLVEVPLMSSHHALGMRPHGQQGGNCRDG